MKKALFGYNVREVDENMEYLEEINAKLEKQVKQLTAELEALKNADREFESLTDIPSAPADSAELTALREEAADLKITNEKLRTTIANMAAELEQRDAAPRTEADELAKVSEICRAAYADMADAKKETKEKLAAFVADFLAQWASYRKRIDDMTAEVSRACDESREAFLAAADGILAQYADLNSKTNDFAGYLDDMDDLESSVKVGIADILRELDQPEAEDASAEAPAAVEEPEEEPEPQRAIFRALKKRGSERREAPQQAPAIEPVAEKKPTPATPRAAERAGKLTAPSDDADIGITVSVNPKNIVNG